MSFGAHTNKAYNVVNLLRNGGLDMVGSVSESPPFWEIRNAVSGGTVPDNSYSIVLDETPDSSEGYPNYYALTLPSSRPVVLRYDFVDQFIQDGRRNFAHFSDPNAPQLLCPYPQSDLARCSDYSTVAQMIRDIDVTVSMSVRVTRGEIRVEAVFEFVGSSTDPLTATGQTIDASFKSKEWERVGTVKTVDQAPLKALSVRVQNVGNSAAVVHLGAICLGLGNYGYLPYTGDPMAEAIPKGTVMFVFGNACPPGFEQVTPSSSTALKKGKVFLRNAVPTSLDVDGSETHTHEGYEFRMSPFDGNHNVATDGQTIQRDDWPKQAVLDVTSSQTNNVVADNGEEAHTHTLEAAYHVPPALGVLLCKRL